MSKGFKVLNLIINTWSIVSSSVSFAGNCKNTILISADNSYSFLIWKCKMVCLHIVRVCFVDIVLHKCIRDVPESNQNIFWAKMFEQVLMNCLGSNCTTTNRVSFMVNIPKGRLLPSFEYVNRTSYLKGHKTTSTI